MRRTPRTESAFTLIELLVVMIIVAVLMAVAVPTFLAQKSTARKTQALANFSMIQKAVESCAARNVDGTYTGCTEHSPLFVYEKALKHLPKCCSANVEGEYDINGVGPGGARVASAGPTDPMVGYEVFTWFNDGDRQVWFQLVHWDDGVVTKHCGAGTRPPWSKAKGAGIRGSRTCPTGTWG
jgi:prepilin-type N-terminal cleavage/methylation domain-containing protein